MNHFIFVANDSVWMNGAMANGHEIALHRLNLKKWPLYGRTRYKHVVSVGDKILVYVGGRNLNRGRIIASCSIGKVEKNFRRRIQIDPEDILTAPAETVIELCDIKYFENLVVFKEKLPDLECKPKNMKKWGVVLIGGVRRICEKDFISLS